MIIYTPKRYKVGAKIKLRGQKYVVVAQDELPVIAGLVEPHHFLHRTEIKLIG